MCEGMHAHSLVWLSVRSVSTPCFYLLSTQDAPSRQNADACGGAVFDGEGWGAHERDLLAVVILDLSLVCIGLDESMVT